MKLTKAAIADGYIRHLEHDDLRTRCVVHPDMHIIVDDTCCAMCRSFADLPPMGQYKCPTHELCPSEVAKRVWLNLEKGNYI